MQSRFARELLVYAEADLCLTVSKVEAQTLDQMLPNHHTRVIQDVEDIKSSALSIEERSGIVFVGNFSHRPNVDAIDFLLDDILPLLSKRILEHHPLQIIGPGLPSRLVDRISGMSHVRYFGWVNSVIPFFQCARLSIAPIRYGAGTKRKILQSLACGTPVVTTSIGAEGLPIGDYMLVGKNSKELSDLISRWIEDVDGLRQFSATGIQAVSQHHSRHRVAEELLSLLDDVRSMAAADCVPVSYLRRRIAVVDRRLKYAAALRLVRRKVAEKLTLFDLDPLTDVSTSSWKDIVVRCYDIADAAQKLEVLLNEFSSFPIVMSREFCAGISVYSQDLAVLISQSICKDFGDLAVLTSTSPAVTRKSSIGLRTSALFSYESVAQHRPRLGIGTHLPAFKVPRRVLVIGAYLADKTNNIHDIVSEFASCTTDISIEQHWFALGGNAPTQTVAAATKGRFDEYQPKWAVVNTVLKNLDVRNWDWVIVADDDIVLPGGFLKIFLALSEEAGFDIAAPGRLEIGVNYHPITSATRSVDARKTNFIEGGPVVAFKTTALPSFFPFDERSGMGWGYSSVWALIAEQHGYQMGIVDATPVSHGLRRVGAAYDVISERQKRAQLLELRDARSFHECYLVLEGYLYTGGRLKQTKIPHTLVAKDHTIDLSVVISTYERTDLLADCIRSIECQDYDLSRLEVVVIDDGSKEVPNFSDVKLQNFVAHQVRHGGISAARNFGLFTARGEIVLFLDDDDIADPSLVRSHVEAHREHPALGYAVLGLTELSSHVNDSSLLKYATESGNKLFSYGALEAGMTLDFRYFWGGRTSVKRAFLARHGVHREDIQYYTDIELGWRLQGSGLKVLYEPRAKSYFNRSISLVDFLQRCEAKGRALFSLLQLHGSAAEIREYCSASRQFERVRRIDRLEELLYEALASEENSVVQRNDVNFRKLSDAYSGAGFVNAVAEAKEKLKWLELPADYPKLCGLASLALSTLSETRAHLIRRVPRVHRTTSRRKSK
jgi:glycosyltransferase involved in cell wall biosynthesis